MNTDLKELMKIDEISQVTAELLLSIGIKNPEMLAKANPEDIHKAIQEKKESIGYAYHIKYIQKWVANAQTGNYLYNRAKERFESLKTRSFDEIMRPILYWCLVKNENLDPEQISFDLTAEIQKAFKESFTDIQIVRENNQTLSKWKTSKKIVIERLKNRFGEYFSAQYPFDDFKRKYGVDNEDRQCRYCEIKESEIALLINAGLMTTKRLYSRGRFLEVDRTNPNGKYNFLNTELCCYWCNNAKTDEFDADDFKLIGEKIGEVWKARLAKIKKQNHDN